MSIPHWYVMKTLLSAEASDGRMYDLNRRILYHNDDPICTFNHRMAEWHNEDSTALDLLCQYLNLIEKE